MIPHFVHWPTLVYYQWKSCLWSYKNPSVIHKRRYL